MHQKGKSNRDLTQVGGNFNKKFFEINFNSRNTSKIFSEFEFYLQQWTQLGEEQQINAFYSCFNSFKKKSKNLEDFKNFLFCLLICLLWVVIFILYWVVTSFSPSLDEFSKHIGVTSDFKSIARVWSKVMVDAYSLSESENETFGKSFGIIFALAFSFGWVINKFAIILFSKNLKVIKEITRTLFNLLNLKQQEMVKQELSKNYSNKQYLNLILE